MRPATAAPYRQLYRFSIYEYDIYQIIFIPMLLHYSEREETNSVTGRLGSAAGPTHWDFSH